MKSKGLYFIKKRKMGIDGLDLYWEFLVYYNYELSPVETHGHASLQGTGFITGQFKISLLYFMKKQLILS